MAKSKMDEPWPIRNAIACLADVRDRETGEDERANAVRLGMEYAIEVVKGINTLAQPPMPDPRQVADRAVRDFARNIGTALHELGERLESIADGYEWEEDGT